MLHKRADGDHKKPKKEEENCIYAGSVSLVQPFDCAEQ
jgi:hypothetical protein